MIKRVLEESDLSFFAVVGLVLFVAIFLGLTVWVLTRSRRQVRTWSELPLAPDEAEPAEPRGSADATPRTNSNTGA